MATEGALPTASPFEVLVEAVRNKMRAQGAAEEAALGAKPGPDAPKGVVREYTETIAPLASLAVLLGDEGAPQLNALVNMVWPTRFDDLIAEGIRVPRPDPARDAAPIASMLMQAFHNVTFETTEIMDPPALGTIMAGEVETIKGDASVRRTIRHWNR